MSKITCECGSSILASSVSRHQKTQKHREYENRSRRAQNQSRRVQAEDVRARVSRAQEKEDRRVEQRSLPKHLIEIVLNHTDEKTCMICYDDLDTSNAFLTRCGHLLCKGCEKIMYKKKNNACPCCRSEF